MGVIEKAFCDLTEHYYFKGVSLEAALTKATKFLGKARGEKYE